MFDLQVKNQLYSFYYIRDKIMKSRRNGETHVHEMLSRMAVAATLGYCFFLDSGAFTYQSQQKADLVNSCIEAGYEKPQLVGKDVDKLMDMLKARGAPVLARLPPPAVYFAEYKEFVRRWGHVFMIIAELDIEGCADGEGGWLEQPQIDGWTDELLFDTPYGNKVMPVYHQYRGDKWLTDWLLMPESPYIGFGSDPGFGEQATPIIAKCHKGGKWVHGFGQAGINTTLNRREFDSIDASTWLRADRFGGSFTLTCAPDGSVLDIHVLTHKQKGADMLMQKKAGQNKERGPAYGANRPETVHKATGGQRRNYEAFYRRFGLDPVKIYADDLVENRRATVIAWREIANLYEGKRWNPPYLWDLWQKQAYVDEHPLVRRIRENR